MKGKIEIKNDVLDIAARLKEIDAQYFVLYDTEKGRFEVHHSGQLPDTLALVLPYDKLDGRTLDRVRRTQRHRVINEICGLEKYNESVRTAHEKNEINSFKTTVKRVFERR